MRYMSKKEFLIAFDKAFEEDIIIDVNTGMLDTDFEMTMELSIIPLVSTESYKLYDKAKYLTDDI